MSQVEQKLQNIQEYESKQIFKICLTGGPCGGKTTALPILSKKLTEKGFNVYTVPETATMIGEGGGMANWTELNEAQLLKWQTALIQTQIQLEKCFLDIAELNNKKAVLLCDRGLMDGSAYMPPELWRKLLSQEFFVQNEYNETKLRDRQYDAVLHLASAANGAVEHYNVENDQRFEDIPNAIRVDKRLQQAWSGHPKLRIIDNQFNSFDDKIQEILNCVMEICGVTNEKQNHLHKNFTISDIENQKSQFPEELIFQEFVISDTYIHLDKSENERIFIKARKRQQGDQSIYQFSKCHNDLEENEKVTVTKRIEEAEYNKLLEMGEQTKKPIVKKRIQFLWEAIQYHIDTYTNVGEQYSTFGVRYNANQAFKIPPFIKTDQEITQKVKASNIEKFEAKAV